MSFSRSTSDPSTLNPAHMTVATAIILVGAWLRLRGAFGEMWFDEIWSYNIAMGLESWHEAFWKQPKDNNHPLNTLWLYLMGPGREMWVYHLFSVITGTASIFVAGWIAARKGSRRSPSRLLVTMLLVAVLYPYINFGSEARGYAPMMLFTVLAYGAVEPPDTKAYVARWGYGLAGLLAVLSHLAAVPVLVALSLCFAIRQRLQGHSFVHALHATVRLNAPLVAGLLVFVSGILYGAHLNGNVIQFGGSTLTCLDKNCFVTALDEMTRFTVGGFGEKASGLYSGLYLIMILGSVLWLAAIGNRRALPLGLILLGVPLLFFAANQPALPHGRYFLAVFAFVPFLVAEVMGELLKRGFAARMFCSVALIALVGANAVAVKNFLAIGRGNTNPAFAYILENSTIQPITIGTEMKYQLKTVMDFVQHRQAPDHSTIDIIKFKNIPDKKPEWLVSVTIHTQNLPAQACTGGLLYTLVHGYGHWGMAGSTWGLYRLSPSPAPKDCVWLTDGRE